MAVHDRIEINPKIMLGKPVILGSRITVELIPRKIAEGGERSGSSEGSVTEIARQARRRLQRARV